MKPINWQKMRREWLVMADKQPNECPICGRPREVERIVEDGVIYTVPHGCGHCEQKPKKSELKVPQRYKEATVEGAEKYAEILQDSSLYLVGEVGAGKTHAACAIGRLLHQQGTKVLFHYIPDLMAQIVAGYKDGTADGIISRAIGADILILDDLGKERPSEHTYEVLLRIVNERYNRTKKTIYTSNYTIGEYAQRCKDAYAQAIASRIKSDCVVRQVLSRDRRVV